ncbi:glycosyltransferase family 2 protein [Oribacterium sp. WCC10]|uniref:glycosyltransferase family 2 protein n=1 Tax=Oribacterium sp. WCC10 TaxID=1855343 RepID=UPI0008E25FE4|nr:glycosyltransferase family 2 protein [Oribacterium sp. WCC10]SFG64108.1 Glycosyl transferase family 2 [Oribacterium sp. WCC10]
MTKGLVSIITPCYNGSKHVAETIESVMSQTYNNWEMIIVDDGSKDKSAEIISGYVKKDNRIKLFQQPNGGSASARNNGIRRAEGQYIALLDADDLWLPEFLEEQIKFMKEKNTICVYSTRSFIDENGNEILSPEKCKPHITERDMRRSNYIPCLTGLYDCSKHGKIYLHEDMKSLKDDYAYWYEIVALENSAYGNSKTLAKYRMTSGSVTSNKTKTIKAHYRFQRTFFKENPFSAIAHTVFWATRGFIKFIR